MSWSVAGTGTPAHLKEVVRRHAHHFWGHMTDAEIGAIRHAISHALGTLEQDALHTFQASGHSDSHRVELHLTAERLEATPLPDPVPEDQNVPGDDATHG